MRGKPCPLCGGTGFLDPRYKLTGAEQRAIREVARGFTQKEAAFHLGIKPKTIKDTLLHVYRKVGVSSTQEAIYVLWLKEHFGETDEILPASTRETQSHGVLADARSVGHSGG